jgi:soluble lytic murein transglycosylase-like protein
MGLIKTLRIALLPALLALTSCAWFTDIPDDWVFDHEDCWIRERSGYGVPVTGKNPRRGDLFAEIHALSIEYRVPVEIIGAVMEQESLGVQYGRHGHIVHNRGECSALFAGERDSGWGPPGLGLMQLTSATARRFDVPPLITDWRYNLRAGVEILDDKYRRVERDLAPEMVETLESNRDILENWYYAVLSYNGWRPNSPYTGRVYACMAAPSREMRGLCTPVTLVPPQDVIPNFNLAHRSTDFTPFAIDEDGLWHLHEGAVPGPFHVTESEWATARGPITVAQ